MKKHYIATLLILSFFLTTFTQAYDWKEESAAKKQAIKYFAVVKHYIDKKHNSYDKAIIKYYSDYFEGEGSSFTPITIYDKEEINCEEAIKKDSYYKVYYINNNPIEIDGFFDHELSLQIFLDYNRKEVLSYRPNSRKSFRIRKFHGEESLDVFYCDSVCHDDHLTRIQDAYLYIDGPDMGNSPLKNKPSSKLVTKDIKWVNELLGVKAGESYRDQDAMKLYEQYSPMKDKYLQDIKKEHNNISIKYFIDWHDPKSYFDSAIDADRLGKEVSQKEALNKGIYSKVALIDNKPIFQEAFNKDKDIMKRYFDEKGRVVFRIDYDDTKEDGFAIFKFDDSNKTMDFIYCYNKQCIINEYLNFDAPKHKGNSEHLPLGVNIVE